MAGPWSSLLGEVKEGGPPLLLGGPELAETRPPALGRGAGRGRAETEGPGGCAGGRGGGQARGTAGPRPRGEGPGVPPPPVGPACEEGRVQEEDERVSRGLPRVAEAGGRAGHVPARGDGPVLRGAGAGTRVPGDFP